MDALTLPVFTFSYLMQFKLNKRWSIAINLTAVLFISGCNPGERTSDASRLSVQNEQQDSPENRSDSNKPFSTNHSDAISNRGGNLHENGDIPNPVTSNLVSESLRKKTQDEAKTSRADEVPNVQQLQDSVVDSLENGKLDEAWESIRLASRINHDNFDTRYLKARVLAERNRFAEAIKQLDQLADEDPTIVLPVLGQTAEWLTYEGRWKAAENRFRQLINLSPEVGLAHRKLAQLLIRQGKRTEACKYFAVLCETGNIEEIELRQLLRIGSAFRGTESSDEQSPIGPLGLGLFEYAEGNLQDALQIIQDHKTTSPAINALAGRLYAITGDADRLANWAKSSPLQDNPFPNFWYAKGVHAQNNNDHVEAINYFCQSVLMDPTDAEAYRRLSESLVMDQQIESAEIATKRSTQLKETHDIGKMFASSQNRDPAKIKKLCELLQKLQRPYESLGWEAVGLVYNQHTLGLSNQEIKSQLQSINQKRTELIEAGRKQPDQSFILCGVKPQLPK